MALFHQFQETGVIGQADIVAGGTVGYRLDRSALVLA